MKTRRVLVIGRGISGLFAALRLQEAGYKVSLLGPASGAGAASYAAVGMSSVKGLLLARDEVFRQKLRGHRRMPALIRELEAKSGRTIPHHFHGVIECFRSPEHYAALRERIFHGEFSGCFNLKVLGPDELSKRSGLVSAGRSEGLRVSGALLYPEDGWFHPEAFLKAVESAFVRAGGAVLNGTLSSVSQGRTSEPSLAVGYQGEGCRQTSPEGATLHSDELVLATGHRLGAMIRNYFEDTGPELTTLPGLTISAPADQLSGLDRGDFETVRFGRYGLSLSPEEIRFGSVDFPKGSSPDPGQKNQKISELAQKIKQELVVSLPDPEAITGLYVIRTLAKNRKPFLKQLRLKHSPARAWVLGGMYKNGFDFAPELAETLVRLLQEEELR